MRLDMQKTWLAIAALGAAAFAGCTSSSPQEQPVEYVLPNGVAVGDDVVVALSRREVGKPDQIEITRVHGGVAGPLAPAVVGDLAADGTYEAQLAAIDGRAYLTFQAGHGFHGAPLGADDAVDAGAIVDLGFQPAPVRLGDRFAAVTYPDPGLAILAPSNTYRAMFVTPDGRRDGDLDVVSDATPIGTLRMIPRCAGNAKVLALLFERDFFFGGLQPLVARVDAGGALLDSFGIELVSDTGPARAGDAQVAVTADGGVLVVYEVINGDAVSVHALRIEPGTPAVTSDQVTDLPRTPTLLVTSGDRILAVTATAPGQSEPTLASFETRVLDDHGRTLSGPFTVATGDSDATVIVTSTGFALLHSGTGPKTQLTAIDRDGKPGDSITLAVSHRE